MIKIGTLRIGVADEETGYVTKLCAYLNKYGEGLWVVSAFTDKKALKRYMSDRKPDILMVTDAKLVADLMESYSEVLYVWLSGEKGQRWKEDAKQRIYTIYRYQSARAVGDTLRDIVEYKGLLTGTGKQNAVIYSPIGRCGKTTLATNYVRGDTNGKWLYVGMEDYGGEMAGKNGAEDFMYYIKEKNEEHMTNIITSCGGIIPSSFSPFDTRLVDREDVLWFFNVFEKLVEYRGVLFDMGTGVLRDFEVLTAFEYVIVPYIKDNKSLEKKKQFEELMEAYELEELKGKLHYLDMSPGDGQAKLIEILRNRTDEQIR